jgi:hypothetical protein
MKPWIRPTARSIAWTPLAGVGVCLAAAAALSSPAGPLTANMVGVAAAALAAAVVAGTHDPAAALLAAVPTSAATRQARRLAMLVPVGLGLWLATIGGSLPGLLALTVVGLAVSARAGVPVGVVVPLAWTAVAWAAGFDWELR